MELSGVQFVARFPGSRDAADLVQPFRGNLERFLAALNAASAAVHIQTTFRPAKRAYLMHFAFDIAKGKKKYASVFVLKTSVQIVSGLLRVLKRFQKTFTI